MCCRCDDDDCDCGKCLKGCVITGIISAIIVVIVLISVSISKLEAYEVGLEYNPNTVTINGDKLYT